MYTRWFFAFSQEGTLETRTRSAYKMSTKFDHASLDLLYTCFEHVSVVNGAESGQTRGPVSL